jgi:choline-sulfatase
MTFAARGTRLVPFLLLAACSTSAAGGAQTRARSAEPAPVAAPAAPVARSEPAGSGAKRAVFYDLARGLPDAELRCGDALLIDFGAPGDVKYTLGGWGTRMRPGVMLGSDSAALVNGSYGELQLPVHGSGPQTVRIRALAPRDGSIVAYLDDKVVAQLKGSPKQFTTFEIALPEGTSRGEHRLRLRASGMGKIGAHSTALALDWVAIGAAPLPAELGLPGASSAGSAAERRTPEAISIPRGCALGYAFKVPEGARFRARLAGGEGRLVVEATDDRLARQALGDFAPGEIDVDLAALAGTVIRLDLRAQAALELSSPQLLAARDPAADPGTPAVRNVLIYLIDTLRADHLKPFNAATRVETPGLDQLVEQGSAVFTSAHTQENWTKPSVATLLTSLLPWEHHAVTTEAVVPASVELLPERLGALGFHTGAFIANGYVSDKFGFKQGWDSYRNYIREGRYSRAEFLAADVLQWLDKRPKKKPFFLYVHAIDPHVPYKPTAQFLSRYDPLPYKGVVDFSTDATLLEKIKLGAIKVNERDKQHLEALYDSEISYHDLHFRAILAALEKRQLAQDTMIVVVADHGEEFWDHGSVGHGHSVYEELLRIPMVIRVPGVTTSPRQIHGSSGLVDIVPTVLDALGKPLPQGLSGRSLLPQLRGEHGDAPPVAVSGFMDDWRTIVIGDLKLIQRSEKHFMVYDLAADPREQRDLGSARPVTARYLRAQLGLALARSQVVASKAPKAQKTKIDAQTEAQLRALGYVGSQRR